MLLLMEGYAKQIHNSCSVPFENFVIRESCSVSLDRPHDGIVNLHIPTFKDSYIPTSLQPCYPKQSENKAEENRKGCVLLPTDRVINIFSKCLPQKLSFFFSNGVEIFVHAPAIRRYIQLSNNFQNVKSAYDVQKARATRCLLNDSSVSIINCDCLSV